MGSHKLLEPRTLAVLAETTTGVVKGCNLSRETAVSLKRKAKRLQIS